MNFELGTFYLFLIYDKQSKNKADTILKTEEIPYKKRLVRGRRI